MGHHIWEMEETVNSVNGWSLQVLWIIILIDKQISSFVDTKNVKNYKTIGWIEKPMKSNGACSLVCTSIDTTPLRFWHTNTQREKKLIYKQQIRNNTKNKKTWVWCWFELNFLTLWHFNIPSIDIQQAIIKVKHYRLQWKTNVISNVLSTSPNLL